MRKNEYTSIEQFTSQYIGEWNPSCGHWLGLDFKYCGEEYRFHTGSMYETESHLENGQPALFGIYLKREGSGKNLREYELLGQYTSMEEALESTVIAGKKFRDVIIDENTELLGQD